MQPELHITTADGATSTVALDNSRYLFGRAPNTDLCYPQVAGLSRQHFILERENGQWVITDLGSTNGTYVNGNRLQGRQLLRADDVITAGQLLLVFRNPSAGASAMGASNGVSMSMVTPPAMAVPSFPPPPSQPAMPPPPQPAAFAPVPPPPPPASFGFDPPPSAFAPPPPVTAPPPVFAAPAPPALPGSASQQQTPAPYAGLAQLMEPEAAVMTNLSAALEATSAPTNHDARSNWLPPVVALMRAGNQLNRQQPLQELFGEVLSLAIETMGAERGVLMTLDNGKLTERAKRGEGFQISGRVRDSVLKEKNSLLVLDAAQDSNFREQQSIVMQQVRTLMAVPLQTDEQVIGLLYLDSRTGLRMWQAEDLNLLTVMANVAAIRLERERNAEAEQGRRMLESELNQAADIQRGFLPVEMPNLPGFDIAGHNAACRTVGGDYFDFVQTSNGRLALILGDVAGKGMPAALMMMNLQARAQVLAETVSEPGEFLSRLNRAVKQSCPPNRFITLFYAVLDPITGTLEYANAGHNPPVICRGVDGSLEELTDGGPILGVLPYVPYQSSLTQLNPGDSLCIYSDGLSEACSPLGEEFGEKRVGQVMTLYGHKPAQQVIQIFNQTLASWTHNAAPSDDVTLIVVKRLLA